MFFMLFFNEKIAKKASFQLLKCNMQYMPAPIFNEKHAVKARHAKIMPLAPIFNEKHAVNARHAKIMPLAPIFNEKHTVHACHASSNEKHVLDSHAHRKLSLTPFINGS